MLSFMKLLAISQGMSKVEWGLVPEGDGDQYYKNVDQLQDVNWHPSEQARWKGRVRTFKIATI